MQIWEGSYYVVIKCLSPHYHLGWECICDSAYRLYIIVKNVLLRSFKAFAFNILKTNEIYTV